MKTFVFALALLACCTAVVPGEFRNLTTTEIDYSSHVQSLIPSSLEEVLKINDLDNQFNTTDFILDKINFVSQKEFGNGYIYKINVDFLNSADEIAQTQFIGTYNAKMKKLSIPSLSYDIKYPKIEEEEIFTPSPINGTDSLGIYKHLRNYLNENFNSTYGFSGNTTMYNNTYIPLDYNKTGDYNWGNNTSMTYNNTYTPIEYNNTNKSWRNTTSMTFNNRTNLTNNNEISSANITDFVYSTLNILVDRFNNTMNSDNNYALNKTSNNVTEIDLTELEPILDDFFKFVTKGVEETFGLSLKEVMTSLLNLGENFDALHNVADTLHDAADELENFFA